MMSHGSWLGGFEDTEEVSTKTHYIYLETLIKVWCSHILDLPIVLIIFLYIKVQRKMISYIFHWYQICCDNINLVTQQNIWYHKSMAWHCVIVVLDKKTVYIITNKFVWCTKVVQFQYYSYFFCKISIVSKGIHASNKLIAINPKYFAYCKIWF